MNTQNHILQLAKKFIAVPSTADNPSGLKKVLEIAGKELQGYFPIEEFENKGIQSLLIHNTNNRTKHFKIILNAHLDVVPGEPEQFTPLEKKGKLFGRGAYDMKAAASVMILLFREIAGRLPYPIGLQITTDEEIGGFNGTKYQMNQGVRCEFAITGEAGSNFQIVNEAKGILHIQLITDGSSAHSAYPWLGENAILSMQEVIKKLLDTYPPPTAPTWKTIVSIVKMKAENDAFNKIPDNCTLDIDIRFIKQDEKSILKNIKQLLPSDVKLKIIQHTPTAFTSPENKYVVQLNEHIENVLQKKTGLKGAYAASDIRYFNFFNCDGVEFGPSGKNHHFDSGEYVDIKNLEDYYNILKNFLLSVK